MIGKNLKKIRINQTKFSQQDLADYLGVDRNTVAAWEKGKADIKSEHIQKIADFLKVDLKDLFESKPTMITSIGIAKNIGDNSLLNGAIIIITDKDLLNDIIEKIEHHKTKND